MEKIFQRYGKLTTVHPKTILGVGIIIIFIMLLAGFKFGGSLSTKELAINNTPASQTTDLVKKHFPSNNGAQAQVVLKSHSKLTTTENQKLMGKIEAALTKDKNVATVISPVMGRTLAQKDHVGYFTVNYKNKKITDHETNNLKRIASRYGNRDTQIELSGISQKVAVSEVPEIVGILVALGILAVTFTSLVTAGLPIISALVGLLTGIGGVFYCAKFVDVPSYDISLAAMVSLAVGIDYALFLVARYKQERQYTERAQALINAVQYTGPSIVFAGATIVIALLSMNVLGIGFLGIMGNMAAIAVISTVLITLLLVPSILQLCPAIGRPKQEQNKRFLPIKFIKNAVVNHSVITVCCSLLILILAALPIQQMHLGLPNDGSKQVSTTERRAYDIKARAYGAGNDSMLVTVIKNTQKPQLASNYVKAVQDQANVKMVTPIIPSQDGKYLMLSVTPKTDSNDVNTEKLVKNLRKIKVNGQQIRVTGSTAMNIDISEKLNSVLPKFLLIITAFAFILLVVALRSLVIPLVAVIGFILSIIATLGAVTFTIQEGHFAGLLHLPGKTAVLNFLPVITIGILFGLAMDYEVFLVRQIHEEYLKSANNISLAVERGLSKVGSAIIAAALIMITVFASFAFTDEIIIQSMGLALAFGVFADAFIVRLLLVPSMIKLCGKLNWGTKS